MSGDEPGLFDVGDVVGGAPGDFGVVEAIIGVDAFGYVVCGVGLECLGDAVFVLYVFGDGDAAGGGEDVDGIGLGAFLRGDVAFQRDVIGGLGLVGERAEGEGER